MKRLKLVKVALFLIGITISCLMFCLPLSAEAKDNYELAGPEYSHEIKIARTTSFDSKGNPTIKEIRIDEISINGNVIALSNEVTSSKKVFLVDTKDYGPMKIKVDVSGDGSKYNLSLYLTPEQKKMLKALGKK